MAFTGVPVIDKVSDSVARITGVSLASGAAGTIGLFGSGANIELPRALNWGPYGDIDLAEAIEVIVNPEIPLTIAKTASPFLCTITNDQAAAAAGQQVYAKMSSVAAQAVADLANHALITFDTETYESSAGIVDLANDRFVVPVAGIYEITSLITWTLAAMTADSAFTLAVQVNALVIATAQQRLDVANGEVTPGTNMLATQLQLAAGDLVTFRVSQVSQAAREITVREATIALVGATGTTPAPATPALEIYMRYH